MKGKAEFSKQSFGVFMKEMIFFKSKLKKVANI